MVKIRSWTLHEFSSNATTNVCVSDSKMYELQSRFNLILIIFNKEILLVR